MLKSKNKIMTFLIALIIALLLANLFVVPTTCAVASADDGITISVEGSYTQEVAPDYATVSMHLQSVDIDKNTAKNATKELFDKAVDTLKGAGIKEDAIITTSFYTTPSFDYGAGKSFVGYNSSLHFTFEADLDALQPAINALVENGIDDILSIQYKLKDSQSVYNDLLKRALSNAEEKAKDIVGSDNLQIIKICEKETYNYPTLYRSGIDVLNDGAYVGKIEITAKMLVKFAIQ